MEKVRTYWVSASTLRGTEARGSVRAASPLEAAKKYWKKVNATTSLPVMRVSVRTSKYTLLGETFDAQSLID